MTPEEAKDKMEEMYEKVIDIYGALLPKGFSVSINVPKEIADLARIYYESLGPYGRTGPFAAGEVFYYKGIRCFAG